MSAQMLHVRFGLQLSSIFIEEEVLFESDDVDRTILQLSFHDEDGQYWLLLSGRYKAFWS